MILNGEKIITLRPYSILGDRVVANNRYSRTTVPNLTLHFYRSELVDKLTEEDAKATGEPNLDKLESDLKQWYNVIPNPLYRNYFTIERK